MIEEHNDNIRSATRRARVVKVDDSRSQQLVDITGLASEAPKKIWRTLDFGFTSVPPQNSDGIIDQLGSRSDRTVYRDAGHELYRPKNTPAGCTALFNQYGDIIRVFQNSADVVHQKQISIRVGHGYAAGQSGDSGTASTSIDDQSGQDSEAISIVLTDSAITLTFANSTVTIDNGGNVTAQAANRFAGGVKNGRWVVSRLTPSPRIDLGVTDPSVLAIPQVETTAGASNIVYAEVS